VLIAEATDAPDTRGEFEDQFTDFLRDRPDIPKQEQDHSCGVARVGPENLKGRPACRAAGPIWRSGDF
jgi:hypothetical protein